MKKFLIVLLVIIGSIATVSKAESASILDVHICQGLTCVDFGPSPGPGPFVNSNVLVGDFAISGSVSTIENALLSNASTTTIAVQRVSTTNDAQGDTLDIWLSATNFALPDISNGYTFRTIGSFTSSAAPTDVDVSFQGWLSLSNSGGFPPADGVTPGVAGCLLEAGTDACSTTTGVLTALTGNNPFSMTTLTSFTIPNASLIASYTSNAQANIVSAVPEPASLFLFGSGLAYLVKRRRDKNNAHRQTVCVPQA